MNEILRLAYLNAMSIDNFVPRSPLIGASSSVALRLIPAITKLDTVESDLTKISRSTSGVEKSTVKDLKQKNDFEKNVVYPPRVSREIIAVHGSDQLHTNLIFSLVMVRFGGILWIDNLPLERGVDQDYLRLIMAISRALGRDGEQPEYSVFEWPLVKNKQTNQSENAAREAVEEFIGRQYKDHAIKKLIVMSEQPVNYDLDYVELIY